MLKIEHLGIAVKQLQESIPLFEQLLNTPCYKTEVVASEHVSTAFFQVADSKIELLEATSAESPIAKFIDKKGLGIHHIAFEVENIHAEISRTCDSHHRIQVGAVHVNQRSVRMKNLGDLADLAFKYPERVRIRYHDGGDVVVHHLFQCFQIDRARSV